jgi:sugar transferase (PEP-CTERM/EpsH1 system associated)
MKNILYICHRIPFPPNKGDKIRTFNEIKFLSKSWNIDLVSFADDPTDLKRQSDLKAFCDNVFIFRLNRLQAKINGITRFLKGRTITEGYFFNKKADRTIAALLKEKNYDSVFCFSSPMAAYIFHNLSILGNNKKPPRLIMDFCDVDSDKWRQYSEKANIFMKWIYRFESNRLLSFEKKINKAFDTSVFVSANEALLFKKLLPEAQNIVSVYNGVDLEYFSNPDKNPQNHLPPTLMFPGAMDYYANIEGVTWFCNKILPKIKNTFPDASFMIVGSNPTKAVKALSEINGVIVTGFVDDIRDYYNKADVCVIPLRIARGIQNKVLESMAMKKPVVATSAASSGIHAEPGGHLLIEDSEEPFANAVINLLQNRDRAEKLGKNARIFVENRYAWDVCLEKLNEILNG